MTVKPVTLEGRFVVLEPLSLDHVNALCEVGLDPNLWDVTMALIRTVDEMSEYVRTALRLQADGLALPFAIVHKPNRRVVGSTRFGNIDHMNRRVEIGWTWVATPWQRTVVNTEAKYLLLKHAFESIGCIRVEFKTDVINAKSRNALLRIGATEEGILRKHMITPKGRIRDTVYYSILDTEWKEVKGRLETILSGTQV
jgi:RimJ/RimL family protein N-acetyltransferase